MKKLFSFLAIVGILLASNCSRIPENDDPVIGIWSDTQLNVTLQAKNQTIKKEWIFNDAYLGRFHSYNNGVLEIVTDFKWSEEDGIYTISYPGLENKTDDVVSMNASNVESKLQYTNGDILAFRE